MSNRPDVNSALPGLSRDLDVMTAAATAPRVAGTLRLTARGEAGL